MPYRLRLWFRNPHDFLNRFTILISSLCQTPDWLFLICHLAGVSNTASRAVAIYWSMGLLCLCCPSQANVNPGNRFSTKLISFLIWHYNDVKMNAMASQITSVSIVCLTVYSGADQRKHQSSASLAFVRWIHRWPVNSPHKRPVRRKLFPVDENIILSGESPGKDLLPHISIYVTFKQHTSRLLPARYVVAIT